MAAVAANGNTASGSAQQAARRLHVLGWPEAAVGSLSPVAKASELQSKTSRMDGGINKDGTRLHNSDLISK